MTLIDLRPPGPPTHRGPAKALLIFGTRPEAVKMAPVVQALARSSSFTPVVAVTAQHREMLDQVLELFAITPDHDLDLLQPGQSLIEITTRALSGLSPLLESERPDVVLVQGDTTTTLAGALAAFYHQIPVVHLEAGLRTGNPRSPFPEETNRQVTTRLASLHLAPTDTSRANLLAEGVDPAAVVVTGNSVIDALLDTVARRDDHPIAELADLGRHDRPVVLVTAHRRESWGEPMQQIGLAVADIARARPDVEVVFPIHRNPLVRNAIAPALAGLANVRLIEPLHYGQFCRLLHRSTLVLTDSGGLQEEAPSLGKPVLVLRDTTERPEAVDAGTVELVGTDRGRISGRALRLLDDPVAYAAMADAINPYGDGRASERTVAALDHFLRGGEPATPFRSDSRSIRLPA